MNTFYMAYPIKASCLKPGMMERASVIDWGNILHVKGNISIIKAIDANNKVRAGDNMMRAVLMSNDYDMIMFMLERYDAKNGAKIMEATAMSIMKHSPDKFDHFINTYNVTITDYAWDRILISILDNRDHRMFCKYKAHFRYNDTHVYYAYKSRDARFIDEISPHLIDKNAVCRELVGIGVFDLYHAMVRDMVVINYRGLFKPACLSKDQAFIKLIMGFVDDETLRENILVICYGCDKELFEEVHLKIGTSVYLLEAICWNSREDILPFAQNVELTCCEFNDCVGSTRNETIVRHLLDTYSHAIEDDTMDHVVGMPNLDIVLKAFDRSKKCVGGLLMSAAKNGNVPVFDWIMRTYPDTNVDEAYAVACGNGRVELAQRMLALNVDRKVLLENTPLLGDVSVLKQAFNLALPMGVMMKNACKSGNSDVVEMLLRCC